MAVINFREVERDSAGKIVGKGSRYLQAHTQSGCVEIVELPSFYRDVRREVLDIVWTSDRPLSRAEIANRLQLKKTTWLICIIEDLTKRGYLVRLDGTWRNGALMYFYWRPR
jgi:hypothetical protein